MDSLCDESSIDVYMTWFALGGPQRGVSPVEALEMPAWLRHDFSIINRYIGEERERVRSKKKPKKPRSRK